jgi:hypothetical protein
MIYRVVVELDQYLKMWLGLDEEIVTGVLCGGLDSMVERERSTGSFLPPTIFTFFNAISKLHCGLSFSPTTAHVLPLTHSLF